MSCCQRDLVVFPNIWRCYKEDTLRFVVVWSQSNNSDHKLRQFAEDITGITGEHADVIHIRPTAVARGQCMKLMLVQIDRKN
jgi:hypothetical protein